MDVGNAVAMPGALLACLVLTNLGFPCPNYAITFLRSANFKGECNTPINQVRSLG